MKEYLYICPNYNKCLYNNNKCYHRTPHGHAGYMCNSNSINCKKCIEYKEEFLTDDDFKL